MAADARGECTDAEPVPGDEGVAALTAAAWDQPEVVVDANVPPARLWTHHLDFSQTVDGVRSAAFSPDGSCVYVHTWVEVVNVWEVLLGRWPEVLGGASAVWVLLMLLVVRRVAKRRQARGAPHCGRCNYDVSGQVEADERGRLEPCGGARCPECGVLLERKRPVRGRGVLARCWPALVAIAAVAGAYGWMVMELPRKGRAAAWFDWSSSTAARWVHAWSLPLGWIREGDQIVRVRVDRGEVDGVVATRATVTLAQVIVSPDGGAVVRSRPNDRDEIDVVSTKGSRRLTCAGPSRSVTLGMMGADEVVLQTATGIEVLDLGSAQRRRAVDLGAVTQSAALVGGEPRMIAQVQSGSGVVAFWDVRTGELRRVVRFSPPLAPSDPRAFSGDGRIMCFVTGGDVLGVLDTETGGVSRVTRGAVARFFDVACSRDGRLAAVGSSTGEVLVRDVQRRSWVARLSLPPGLYATEPSFSPDGRWLLAVTQSGDGRTSPFWHHLVMWNLSEILGEGSLEDAS